MVENIDSLWVIITGIIAGIASILAWLKRKKTTNDAKDISQTYNVKIKKVQYTNGNGTITYINPLTGNTLSLNSGESLALNCNETFK